MNNIEQLIKEQINYSNQTLNLIASENYPFNEIYAISNPILFSKYAEGEPNKRYYNGCQYVDQIELEAQNQCNLLFGSNFCNVQVSSGTIANLTVIFNLINPGDTILSLQLNHGGHLSHGFKKTLVGKIFNIEYYHLNQFNSDINYEEIEKLVIHTNCSLIILGYSSCTFDIDYKRVRDIINRQDRKIYLLADIAHISGFVVSKLMNHPFPYADVITTTTHKHLRGPRGAIIAWNDSTLNFPSFPLLQGGPDMQSIAMKSIAFQQCRQQEYIEYCQQVLINSKSFYHSLKLYFELTHPETNNHMNLIQVSEVKKFVDVLESYGIIVNANFLPSDDKKCSGIRVGTAALTTRGATPSDFDKIAESMYLIYKNSDLIRAKQLIQEVLKNLTDL